MKKCLLGIETQTMTREAPGSRWQSQLRPDMRLHRSSTESSPRVVAQLIRQLGTVGVSPSSD